MKHKRHSEKNKFSKPIYESLFVFHKCFLFISYLFKKINEMDPQNMTKYMGYYLLEIYIFSDEYRNHFTHKKNPDYADRILVIKKCLKPLFNKICDWDTCFRNSVVAHNYRYKSGEMIDVTLDGLAIPRNPFEYALLSEYFICIKKVLHDEFTVEYNEMFNEVENFIANMSHREPPDFSDINLTNNNLCEQVNSELRKSGRNTFITMTEFGF